MSSYISYQNLVPGLIAGKGEKPIMHHSSKSGTWYPNRTVSVKKKGVDGESLRSNVFHNPVDDSLISVYLNC